MPRKSERTKKTKSSPEKTEKMRRTRTSRRRKASSSSEAESDDSRSKVTNAVQAEDDVTTQAESEEPKVWQVKSEDSSSGTGEIKKLKICLSTKLPATPEPDAVTPRSRKKLNRTVSETPIEGTEEKRRSRHKSRRGARESHEGILQETQSEDEKKSVGKILQEKETNDIVKEEDHALQAQNECEKKIPCESEPIKKPDAIIKESEHVNLASPSSFENSSVEQADEPIIKIDQPGPESEKSAPRVDNIEKKCKATSIAKRRRSRRLSGSSPERELTPEPELVKLPLICEEPEQHKSEETCSNNTIPEQKDIKEVSNNNDKKSEEVFSNLDQDKIEIDPEDIEMQAAKNLHEKSEDRSPEVTSEIQEEIEPEPLKADIIALPVKTITKEPVVHNNDKSQSGPKYSDPTLSESNEVLDTQSRTNRNSNENKSIKTDALDQNNHSKEQTAKEVSKSEEPMETYNAAPIVVSRKRRWGSRVSKSSASAPVCISTDVLKDIIPEVKPVELEEAIEDKKQRKKSDSVDRTKVERPILPKIVIDNSENANAHRREREKEDWRERKNEDRHEWNKDRHDPKKGDTDSLMTEHRKISIIKENSVSARPPSPSRNKSSNILYITHLVRPFTLPQLKNLLQRTGKIMDFWIDRIKSKCFVTYENEDQAIETRHALHGVTWPVSNPKTLQVDFSSQEHIDKVRALEEDKKEVSTIPGTVEDWLKEQDMKKDRYAEMEDSKSRDKRTVTREWDEGKGEKAKERERHRGERVDERTVDKYRQTTSERSPAMKFPKKEEAPAKMLDDLFRKTKTVPCIYWLPLSEETIAIKEEQRRLHMAENERRMAELERARAHRRH